MNNIRNLLFDLDGTLVDSSRTIGVCIDYALDKLGIDDPINIPLMTVIGSPLWDIFLNQFRLTEEQAECAIQHYREHYDRLEQAGTQVYDGIQDALSALRNGGFRLFIATVKPTAIAEKVLSDLQLRMYFDGVAGASMGHERRDKASIIAHALQQFDLDPDHSLMIGDRGQDVLGARQNGLPCIAVSYGFGSQDELDSARPDHRAGHAREIVALLMNPAAVRQSKPL